MSKLRSSRGQALIEFAIVLPLILLVIIGGIGTGLVLLHRMQLEHAAQETAIAAAQQNCSVAPARAAQLLGYAPQTVECKETGQLVNVVLVGRFPVLLPALPETIRVSAGATRRDEPSASP